MTKEFQEKILETLQEQDVTPKARWTFLVKEKMMWGSALIVIIFGSLAAATSIAIISMHDLDIAERLEHTKVGWILLSLPYAWFIILAGFILLAEYNIRHTKQGYRYSLPKLTAAVVGLSIIGGVGLYTLGLGHTIDTAMDRHIPAYAQFGNRRELFLLDPDHGVLAGRVISQHEDTWEIRDMKKDIWILDISESTIIGEQYISIGIPIRVTGKMIEPSQRYHFIAEEVIPLHPPKEFHQQDLRKKYKHKPMPPNNISNKINIQDKQHEAP